MSSLRMPISIMGSYAAPFAMMGHHEMNGSLTSPRAYASLHNIPPQMSAAATATAAYIQSPMVSFGGVHMCTCGYPSALGYPGLGPWKNTAQPPSPSFRPSWVGPVWSH
uniref:Uncharacterized protein n=1 Tax=Anas platyrhynchos platyrhynchos TaxID=8840 RepID=A0A493SXX6_ANAPP